MCAMSAVSDSMYRINEQTIRLEIQKIIIKSRSTPCNYDIINVRLARQSIPYLVSANYVFNICVFNEICLFSIHFIRLLSLLLSFWPLLRNAHTLQKLHVSRHADRSPYRQRERKSFFFISIFFVYLFMRWPIANSFFAEVQSHVLLNLNRNSWMGT